MRLKINEAVKFSEVGRGTIVKLVNDTELSAIGGGRELVKAGTEFTMSPKCRDSSSHEAPWGGRSYKSPVVIVVSKEDGREYRLSKPTFEKNFEKVSGPNYGTVHGYGQGSDFARERQRERFLKHDSAGRVVGESKKLKINEANLLKESPDHLGNAITTDTLISEIENKTGLEVGRSNKPGQYILLEDIGGMKQLVDPSTVKYLSETEFCHGINLSLEIVGRQYAYPENAKYEDCDYFIFCIKGMSSINEKTAGVITDCFSQDKRVVDAVPVSTILSGDFPKEVENWINSIKTSLPSNCNAYIISYV